MGQLQKTLGPLMIWGLGVGYVISGAYFGWNLGLPVGGPYGMLLATGLVTVLYVTFVLGYAELSCAIPRAGPGPRTSAGSSRHEQARRRHQAGGGHLVGARERRHADHDDDRRQRHHALGQQV
jgi:hypothetical protein